MNCSTEVEQTLLIETKITKIGTKSFELKHTMSDKETGQLIAKGTSVEVHVNPEKQESEPIPEPLREQLEKFVDPAN